MITRLTIENFKSILKTTLDTKHLNILAGVNSSGKSSILQALLLPDVLEIASLKRLGECGDFKDLKCIYAKTNDNIVVRVQFGEKLVSYTLSESGLYFTPIADQELSHILQARYISADRLGPRVSYHTPKGAYIRDVGARGENVIPYCTQCSRDIIDDTRSHPDTVGTTFEYNLESWMQEICPGVRFNFLNNADIDISALSVGTKGEQTVWQRPTNVGFGISYTLPVVASLLGARPGDILLIENPEAHLHPRGQTKMGELLARAANAGLQIFVETHSDHLIDGIRIAVRDRLLSHDQCTVFFCTKSLQTNLTEVDSINFMPTGDLARWPAGFCDQSIKNLSKLAEF